MGPGNRPDPIYIYIQIVGVYNITYILVYIWVYIYNAIIYIYLCQLDLFVFVFPGESVDISIEWVVATRDTPIFPSPFAAVGHTILAAGWLVIYVGDHWITFAKKTGLW